LAFDLDKRQLLIVFLLEHFCAERSSQFADLCVRLQDMGM